MRYPVVQASTGIMSDVNGTIANRALHARLSVIMIRPLIMIVLDLRLMTGAENETILFSRPF